MGDDFKTVEGPASDGDAVLRDMSAGKAMEHDLGQAESRSRAIFEHAPLGIALVDGRGRIVECNRALGELFGYCNHEMCGRLFRDFITEEDHAADADLYEELLGRTRVSYHLAVRCVKKNGGIAWGLLAVSLMQRKEDDPVQAIRIVEDITDRKRAEEAFLKSRNSYLALIDEFPNPIRRTDTEGHSDFFNRAWLAFTGRTAGQEAGSGWYEGVHPEDTGRLKKLQQETFRACAPYVVEYRLMNYTGKHRWILEFGRPFDDIEGDFGGYMSSCYDVQERKDFESKLEAISTTDELTGLLNRRGFFSLAQQQLKVSNRAKKGTLLIYADLDGLKQINDSLGHPEGDQALIEASEVLKEAFRESDIIARLGGDEFAVLMPEHSGSVPEQEAVRSRLLECVTLANKKPGRRYTLAFSIGMAYYDPQHPGSLDELISHADALMYRAKEAKRGKSRLFLR